MVDVDGFMAYVIISADDEVRPLLTQFRDPRQEVLEKLHLEILPYIACRTAGYIGINDGEVAEIGTQHPSLAVVFGIPHADDHFVRYLLGEDTHAGITLLLCRMDIGMIAQFLERQHVYLLGLRLALLNTEYVGLLGL